jgi:hypothetical protein
MKMSPSIVISCSATQEFYSILLTPKVHYRVHKSTPLVAIQSQINPFHAIQSYFRKIHLNIVLLPLDFLMMSCSVYSTLRMEAISSLTFVDFQRITRRYMPENSYYMIRFVVRYSNNIDSIHKQKTNSVV